MLTPGDFTAVLAALSLSASSSKPEPPVDQIANSFIQTSTGDQGCSVTPYSAPPIPDQVFPPFDRKQSSIYRYRQQQSVNLGSWFVQENWMVPSLFACAAAPRAGEHDVASGWNNTTLSRQVLERHWDTFIQETDFAYLQSIGINTVRLPIGYWSLGPQFCIGTAFEDVMTVYENSWKRVLRAINTAGAYGIGVLVDLHGAPGSQNGQSHSGISDGQTTLFGNEDNINKTISALTFITQQLVNVNNVVGIQLLNEPKSVDSLPDFYTQALTAVRNVSAEAARFPFYIHDAFNLEKYSDYISKRTDFLVEDHHAYYVYTPSDMAESAQSHTNDVNTTISSSLRAASLANRRNLVVDEWSCALTARSLSQEPDPMSAQRDFCTGQMGVYADAAAGWGFWSYYKEDCETDGGWCFRKAVGQFLPQTFFSYPRAASNGGTPSAPRNPLAAGLNDPTAQLLGSLNDPPISEIVFMAYSNNAEGTSTMSTTPPPPAATTTSWSTAKFMSSSSTMTPAVTASAQPHRRAWSSGGAHHRKHSRSHPTSRTYRAQRRDDIFDPSKHPDAPYNPLAHMSPSQVAIARGYQDGFQTAKVFAQYGMSKLGFTGQYISDTLSELVAAGTIAQSEQITYETWFMKGLRDAEAEITAASSNTPVVYPGAHK